MSDPIIDPPVSPPPTPPAQAQQRASLQQLITLASESAETETKINTDHASALVEAERTLGKKLFDVNQAFEHRKRQIANEFAERTDQSAARYTTDAAALAASDNAARQRVEGENDRLKQDINGKLQQAIWLAESVHEATQNQLSKDYKKAKEDHGTRLEAIEALNRESAETLATFGQPKLFGTIEADEAELAGITYEERLAETKLRLQQLRTLAVPRLFVGMRPILIFLVVVILGAVVGQLIAGGLPYDLAHIDPKIKQIAYGAGIAAVLAIGGGIALRMLGNRQVRAAYVPVVNALDVQRYTADAALEDARVAKEEGARRAAIRRDSEIKVARDKVAPYQQRAAQKHSTAMTNLATDFASKSGAVDDLRRRDESEANDWQSRALASVKKQHETEILAVRQQYQQTIDAADAARDTGKHDLELRWNNGIAHLQAGDDSLEGDLGQPAADWEDWTPPTRFNSRVRFGELQVDLATITDQYPRELALPPSFAVPATLQFPQSGSLMIHTDHAGRAEALRVQQMLIARLLTQIPPGRARFTIIDPVGLGQNFAGFMKLADHDEQLVGTRIWTEAEHIEQQLSNLTEHMETVIQKYLRNEFATIDEYNAQAGELAEPYRFLVIADFPVSFEAEALRRLNSIATSGARCGVFFIVVRDTRSGQRSGMHLDELITNCINLDRVGDRFVWRDEVFKQFPLQLDEPPTENFFNTTLDVIGQRAKANKRVEVAFDAIMPPASEIWTGNTASEIVVPIGRLGATRLQLMKLGRGVAQHALIAGKTGSGKSTLLHILITNLSLWYGPDQLEFYLVDFKKGVEFKTYATHRLPHARAVAVESDREFGLSVLQRIDAELSRRGELFRNTGVQDLAAFRKAAPDQVMPRTLLMIDEFQEFFSEDDKLAQEAGLLLDRLVRQGRAFGVHVLLGSQTIGGSSGLARSTIGQMAVRIALQTSEADSQLILGDANVAARLLSRPGEAIYNDAGGLVENNSPFQISWLADAQRETILQKLQAMAEKEESPAMGMIVFEGNSRADITANRQLRKLVNQPLTKTPSGNGSIWLGEPVAIKDPTAVTLRQQAGSNLIIIGQNDDASLALLGSGMISLTYQRPDSRIIVMDGTPADSSLAEKLASISAALPKPAEVVDFRNVGEVMNSIAAEVKTRMAAERSDFPPIYLMIAGLQRFRVLRKTEESFGGFGSDDAEKPAAPDKCFADVLRDGPAVGVHILAAIDTSASIDRTLDRGALREFDQRVLFQMSANDSSTLIDSPAANKLGFYRALLFSEERGTIEKFRPYALFDARNLLKT